MEFVYQDDVIHLGDDEHNEKGDQGRSLHDDMIHLDDS